MPSSESFLEEFGLIEGKDFKQFKLIKVKATHIVIVNYHEYKYNIILKFKGDDIKSLHRILKNKLSDYKIIYGIKNPYTCCIEEPLLENFKIKGENIIVNLKGYAIR